MTKTGAIGRNWARRPAAAARGIAKTTLTSANPPNAAHGILMIQSPCTLPERLSLLKDLFDPHRKQPRDLERERQARIVASRLDEVDRLPAHAEMGREIRLR